MPHTSLPKVTICTPIYNGEKYMRPSLDSLLAQTYTHVEFIYVNDGSTDQTDEIFLNEYQAKFESKGWVVKYFKKENGGAASAINVGLKNATGDYFTWPDGDDIFAPTYIERYVDFLETHPEYDFCYADIDFVKDTDLETVIFTRARHVTPDNDPLFMDIIRQNNAPPLAFCMARMNALQNVLCENQILESKSGQNLQLLLPLTYAYKGGYIHETLGKCLVRTQSHSHHFTLSQLILQIQNLHELGMRVISNMKISDEEKRQLHLDISIAYGKEIKRLRFKLFRRRIVNFFKKMLGIKYKPV